MATGVKVWSAPGFYSGGSDAGTAGQGRHSFPGSHPGFALLPARTPPTYLLVETRGDFTQVKGYAAGAELEFDEVFDNLLGAREIMPLNVSGDFYPAFTDNAVIYGQADRACIQQTVEHLLSARL